MSQRTAFKIFGSLGPAGAIVTIAEKISKVVWYEAYEQGAQTDMKVEAQVSLAKEQRAAYVADLFKVRGSLNRKMESFKPEVKEAAYKELAGIIEHHAKIISRTEKTRLLRERMHFKGNPVEYQKRITAARRVSADTDDNLIKMALKLVENCKKDELTPHITSEDFDGTADAEDGNIETRVTRADAERLLEEWKKILVQHENEGNNIEALLAGGASGANTTSLINNDNGETPELEQLKDKLFVSAGEDPYDIFLSFQHYGLNTQVTDADRRAYA